MTRNQGTIMMIKDPEIVTLEMIVDLKIKILGIMKEDLEIIIMIKEDPKIVNTMLEDPKIVKMRIEDPNIMIIVTEGLKSVNTIVENPKIVIIRIGNPKKVSIRIEDQETLMTEQLKLRRDLVKSSICQQKESKGRRKIAMQVLLLI